MSKLDLNVSPYFDDYDSTKDFHKVLYKPGIPVQARELTQSQTILQEQISRFGNHIFVNGARVSGGQVSINQNVYSLKVSTVSALTSLKAGLYIKGITSGLVAEVISVDSLRLFVVYMMITQGSYGSKFIDGESVYVYSDAALTVQYALPITLPAAITTQVTASGDAGTSKLTATSVSTIQVGDYVSTLNAQIITIDPVALTFDISTTLPAAVVSESLTVITESSAPTALFGVSDGIFYINGYFVRVGTQSVVPYYKNRWASITVGLLESEEVVDSDADATLLDPAQGSYNYSAPGADRLKVSFALTSYDQDTVSDPSFIELIRYEAGTIVRQNKNTDYADLMTTIARRTYDESGNYIVNPFIINIKDEGAASTVSAVINPGKAYVGGYEFETLAPVKVKIDRARDTETATNFGVGSYIGNYVYISTESGPIPAEGTTLTIKLASVTKGTAVFMGLGIDASLGLKMYLANISGTFTSGMNLTSAGFTCLATSSLYDIAYTPRLFDLPQTYVSGISNVSYHTKRVFRNVTFSAGVATIIGANSSERFAGGSGVLAGATALTYYSLVNTAYTAFSVNLTTVGTGATAQCLLTAMNGAVADTSFNGTGTIIATVIVNSESARLKTKNLKLLQVASLVANTPLDIGYADGYNLYYAALNTNSGANRGEWVAGTYSINDIVSHNNTLYQTSAAAISTDVPGVAAKWVAMPNLASTLTFNNGQTDMWYDHCTITSATARTNLVVLFDYFSHAGSGLLTVNSYPVSYANIPSYKAADGTTILLQDAIDARPRRVDLSGTLLFDTFQIPDETGVTLDNTYYMSRIDKLVLTNDKKFKVIKGVSSYYQPLPPADINDAMTLATIILPPYTSDATQIQKITPSNRRYTMRDIGLLDQRLSNVEYYVSLSTLESSVMNSTFYNPGGTTLFKAGFLADNFSTFNIGNTSSLEYKCSIDTSSGVCRPRFVSSVVALGHNAVLSTTSKTGDLVTLPYTLRSFIKNIQPTSTMNINPFNVLRNIGISTLTPSSDYWYDTVALPVINVLDDNTSAFAQAQAAAAAYNQQAQWNAWTVSWTGVPTSSSTKDVLASWMDSSISTTHGTYQTVLTTNTTSIDTTSTRSKSVQSVSASTIVTSDNTVVVSSDLQPYIRARDISFEINGMTPYTPLYAWIDDVNVSSYITPGFVSAIGTVLSSSVTNGGSGYTTAAVSVTGGGGSGAIVIPIIVGGIIERLAVASAGSGYTSNPGIVITGDGTGATGSASITVPPDTGAGLSSDIKGKSWGVLHFPNDTTHKFACGTHKISFTDDPTSNYSATCFSASIYTANGYLNNTQRTIVSTRIPVSTTSSITESTSNSVDFTTSSTADIKVSEFDPLAETFFIDSVATPNGVFAANIDIFFETKDQSMPVVLEIRPTVNGYPSSDSIVPFSTVIKYPEDINLSVDGTVPTTFTFPSPVYLIPGEYAVVLKSGSNKYHVYVSVMNEVVIGTAKVISDQPYIGSLFESQNSSTWSADQYKDLCFELRVCSFDTTASRNLVLTNTEAGVQADLVHSIVQNIQPGNTSITTVAALPTYTGSFILNSDVSLDSQSTIASAGDVTLTLAFESADSNISPVVDMERTGLITIANVINASTGLTTAETDKGAGSALAKYVTRKVTLNQNFNASNLVVYLNVNRPQTASIKVYFRAKNAFDTSDLGTFPWVLLNQEINGGSTSADGYYVEDKWSVYGYTYNSFLNFNQYEVKVVMFSTNSSRVPSLGDIRAIALA